MKGQSIQLNSKFHFHDHEENRILVVDWADFQHTIKVIDLSSFKTIENIFPGYYPMHNIDKVENGYFIHGKSSFQLLAVKNGEIELKEFESFRKSSRASEEEFETESDEVNNSYISISIISEDASDLKTFKELANATKESVNGITYRNIKQLQNSSAAHAYYFTKTDKKEWALVEIEKKSGNETARYVIGDKSPVYAIDNTNRKLYHINKNQVNIYTLENM